MVVWMKQSEGRDGKSKRKRYWPQQSAEEIRHLQPCVPQTLSHPILLEMQEEVKNLLFSKHFSLHTSNNFGKGKQKMQILWPKATRAVKLCNQSIFPPSRDKTPREGCGGPTLVYPEFGGCEWWSQEK